jgi:hypothetical protein
VNVDDVVAERIEQARRRIEANKRRRATQQAARQAGLIARHRVKLARLEAEASSVPANGTGDQPSVRPNGRHSVPMNEEPSARTCNCGRTPDPGVCPIQHSQALPAGGHCACIHLKPNDPTAKENQ